VLRTRSPPAGVQYLTDEVRRGNLTVSVTATGALEPLTQINVGTETSGIVDRVAVDFNAHHPHRSEPDSRPVMHAEECALRVATGPRRARLDAARSRYRTPVLSVRDGAEACHRRQPGRG
jgi:hypothetical protein